MVNGGIRSETDERRIRSVDAGDAGDALSSWLLMLPADNVRRIVSSELSHGCGSGIRCSVLAYKRERENGETRMGAGVDLLVSPAGC